MVSRNSFAAAAQITVGDATMEIFRVAAVPGSDRLPFTHKVLLENLLRTEDGTNVTAEQITALGGWDPAAQPSQEIQFTPARVIMQDFTGVPCVVDLATMREAVSELGGDPDKINPLSPAELVIDHSVIADYFGSPDAFERGARASLSPPLETASAPTGFAPPPPAGASDDATSGGTIRPSLLDRQSTLRGVDS